jgi:APA family basic amino acid/polyamine antiporter
MERHSNGSQPSISLVTATAIVVSNMIGTGIFTSLGFQVADIHSGFVLVLLWVIGGVCALCGALAYGELAATLPRSGGEYHFLSAIIHPAAGFVAGWTSATVGFAAPIAMSAMAFAKYFHVFIPWAPPLLLSLAVVWITSLIHGHSLQAGSLLQNSITWGKVLLILCFIVAGVIFGNPQPVSFLPASGDPGTLLSDPFAISLIYVMYAYSGWNASTYIISEVRDAKRNVPRSLVFGCLIVTVLYVALNMVFLYTTPMAKLSGQIEIGLIAGTHTFGEFGGRLVAALICLVLVSSISSMTWIGPRVSMTMGEDVRLLRLLAKKSARGTPVVAIFLQLLVVHVLLLTTTFTLVLIYIQFTLLLCSFLTVLGMMILRVTHRGLPRPIRTWGYPLTPLLFLGICLFMMLHVIKTKPMESIAGLATMLSGLAIYIISTKKAERLHLKA